MNDEIKVGIVAYPDRKHLVMRYRDPFTRKTIARSTGTSDRREAQKAAGKWEAELREGRYAIPAKLSWDEFQQRYNREVLSGLSVRSRQQACVLFGKIDAIIRPDRLRDVTAERISYFQAKLREQGLSENTIEGYSAYLRAALNWAEKIGLMPKAPPVARPKRAKSSKAMKGRPITREEFERMLGKVDNIVGDDAAASWKHYLEGLWCSGLRLDESLELYWDRDDRLCVEMNGEDSMLRIPAELEKGHQDRLLPMAPEFAEFLERTHQTARTGRVFNPLAKRRHGERMVSCRISHLISCIGKAANVKVNTDPKSGKVKYASAHDLRRSFGERWATRVMPQVLMELMRHESIETTLRYYVGRNAKKTTKLLWEAHRGNNLGNNGQKDAINTEV